MADETISESPDGGTAWRRFAYVALPGLAAAGILTAATTQGLLAASFAVSGDHFKISATQLDGTGFAQYGDVATSVDDTSRPVGLSIIEQAELSDMCMSALVDLPIGTATVLIHAGEDTPVTATNMVVDVEQLEGNASFSAIEIGRDASTLNKVSGPQGEPGGFALQSDTVVIDDLTMVAWAVNSGTLRLSGLKLNVKPGTHECF
ncbi:MAG TPA: DUF6230 family protein [Thermobifida alba]|nr:DUF6230 family protein [Thermobifida alba]